MAHERPRQAGRNVGRCTLAGVALMALVAVAASGSMPSQAAPTVSAGDDPDFLANWMHHVMPVIQNSTILDLSLPGTHDSMTWDLSETVSDGANDLNPTLSWVLHMFKSIFGIGGFIRDQAKTQGLDMVQQLDNGIRFIDFRIMYTAAPEGSSFGHHDWYCLVCFDSQSKSIRIFERRAECVGVR